MILMDVVQLAKEVTLTVPRDLRDTRIHSKP